MVASHASIDSSGPHVAGLLVITSETFVVPTDFPMATAFTQMSRSVMMPSNFRSLQSFTTGIAPTSLSFISFAACWIPSVGVQQKRFLLIISSIFMRPPAIRAVSRRTDGLHPPRGRLQHSNSQDRYRKCLPSRPAVTKVDPAIPPAEKQVAVRSQKMEAFERCKEIRQTTGSGHIQPITIR